VRDVFFPFFFCARSFVAPGAPIIPVMPFFSPSLPRAFAVHVGNTFFEFGHFFFCFYGGKFLNWSKFFSFFLTRGTVNFSSPENILPFLLRTPCPCWLGRPPPPFSLWKDGYPPRLFPALVRPSVRDLLTLLFTLFFPA